MAALGRTILGRILLGVLAVHVVVLPILYFGMVYLLERSNEELFLDSTRGHARFLADSLERIGTMTAHSEIVEILDSVVLSGSGVYSELASENFTIRSSLVDEAETDLYREDFAVGEHDDNVYYISVPVTMGKEIFSLRLGFDEASYLEHNARAHRNGQILIVAYLALLLALLPLVSRRIVRPVRDLQKASHEIASGELSGRLSTETDLVEFVELSRDLEHMKDRLLGMNAALQMEIVEREQAEANRRNLEQQLRHSQRLETIGTMAGGIAHELNNILVPIILYAEMAVEDLPNDNSVRVDMQRVLTAAKRAKGLVGQVLTFGRKMSSTDTTLVDLSEIVRESLELLGASLPPAVNLDIDLADDCLPVLADPGLLSQLTLNLCTNALQALPDSTGTIRVALNMANPSDEFAALHPTLAEFRLAQLTIEDTGHGMSEQTISRIFEPFFTTRPVGKGTGLGLSVAHGIVADLGGVIEVESALELGSSFSVYIPAFENSLTIRQDTASG